MSTKTSIIVASGLGIIVGLTIIGIKEFIKKKTKEYDDYYADFHRHFESKSIEDTGDGVEFLAVK